MSLPRSSDYPGMIGHALGLLRSASAETPKDNTAIGTAQGILAWLQTQVPPARSIRIHVCMDCQQLMQPAFTVDEGKDSLPGQPAYLSHGICDGCAEKWEGVA